MNVQNKKDRDRQCFEQIANRDTDCTVVNSPNLYTNRVELDRSVGKSTSRGSLERKNYISMRVKQKNLQKAEDERIQLLMKENGELRKEIVDLKVQQFYHFDDKKLKDLISECETIKKQLKKYQQKNKALQQENDFLRRSNVELKKSVQRFCKQNNTPKAIAKAKFLPSSPRVKQPSKEEQKVQLLTIGEQKRATGEYSQKQSLLNSKSTDKIHKAKKIYKESQDDYLLLLQSKRRNKETDRCNNQKKASSENPAILRTNCSPSTKEKLLKYRSKRHQESGACI